MTTTSPLRSVPMDKGFQPNNPFYYGDQAQCLLILGQEASVLCQLTELLKQANHVLAWKLEGTSPS